jgi:hypothetical protein
LPVARWRDPSRQAVQKPRARVLIRVFR